MGRPHVVAIPTPAQGHVIPLLELMHSLAKHGFKITFVNTNFNHKRIMNALSKEDNVGNLINFVSIPDGLEPWEERNDFERSIKAMNQVMPGKLEELMQNIKQSDEENICVISSLGHALRIAKKLQIKRAYFWPAAAATLCLVVSIQKMMDDGVIDDRGIPITYQMIQQSPTMPTINTKNLPWLCFVNGKAHEIFFQQLLEDNKLIQTTDWQIGSSFYDLEPAAFSLCPNLLPIGPLLASNRIGKSVGCFWPEDSTCLKWLDQQPPNSVIYVAFGSFTVFDNTQFKELALGLELTNRPFLWVVRPDIVNDKDDAYPEGFKERVGHHGRMVGWAPQQAVLSHPSIACFLSHCGWNSTMEGISNGVPFLCWPYFADQFLDQSYICDVWKIGLGFERDKKGIIRKNEIKDKVEQLLTDESYKAKALELKKMAADSIKEGGHSHNNLAKFVEWIKI